MSHTLSPYTIKTLFHVYASAEPFQHTSSALKQSLAMLERYGMVERTNSTQCGYRITSRGLHHVHALCCLPLPEPIEGWTTPGCTFKVED